MTMEAKLLSHLGLCMRAGKLATGEEGVMNAIRSGEAKLVVLALDASANARKKYRDKCASYRVALLEASTRGELGACVGKLERVALAVCDDGFARLIGKGQAKPTEVK
jgi:ribosomal protein L7Ae-like RNA K-turn-binding protein